MDINNIYEFYKKYYELEMIPRTGWVMRNVPEERLESIADHTLQTIVLSCIIGKSLNLKLNFEKLFIMLLIHDLAEVKIGDILDISKEHQNKEEKEKVAMQEILSLLPQDMKAEFHNLWLEFEEQSSDEAIFAYQIDKLDAILKSKIYSDKHRIPELFQEFSEFQIQKGTFNNSQFKELFDSLVTEENSKKLRSKS